MSSSKIVLDVEAFNDIWYINCIGNAIIPVAKYFVNRVDSFIISDLGIQYNLSDDKKLSVDIKNQAKSISYIEKLGIDTESQTRCSDLISSIKKALQNNKLVMLSIDCFYETVRKDTYHKNHWGHAVLVHGYEDDLIYIIESDFADSVKYEKRKIEESALAECYYGYLNNLCRSENELTYHEFSLQNRFSDEGEIEKVQNEAVRENLENVVSNYKVIKKSLSCLDTFARGISAEQSDEYVEYMNTCVDGLNKIISSLKVNQYICEKYLEIDWERKEIFDELIMLFCSTRSIFAKIYFSKRNNEVYEKRVQENFQKIKGLSIRMFDEIVNLAKDRLLQLE